MDYDPRLYFKELQNKDGEKSESAARLFDFMEDYESDPFFYPYKEFKTNKEGMYFLSTVPSDHYEKIYFGTMLN